MLLRNSNLYKYFAFGLTVVAHFLFLGVLLRPSRPDEVSSRRTTSIVELLTPKSAEATNLPKVRKAKQQLPSRSALVEKGPGKTERASDIETDKEAETETATKESSQPASTQSQPNYATEVRREIELHKKYPRIAQSRNQQGRVEIRLSIAKDGECREVVISKSSGYKILDEAASQAVKDVGRFNPFPEDLKLSQLELIVPIDFVL